MQKLARQKVLSLHQQDRRSEDVIFRDVEATAGLRKSISTAVLSAAPAVPLQSPTCVTLPKEYCRLASVIPRPPPSRVRVGNCGTYINGKKSWRGR